MSIDCSHFAHGHRLSFISSRHGRSVCVVGPARSALGAGFMPAVCFVLAMLVSMWLRFLGSLFVRS